jgi:Cytochrome c554 and c-prime
VTGHGTDGVPAIDIDMHWKYLMIGRPALVIVKSGKAFGRVAALLLLFATAVLFVFAGCHPPAIHQTVAASIGNAGFLGNAACARCHAAECSAVSGTMHATTMRAATHEGLGNTAPPPGAVPLAGYSIAETGGRFAVSRQYPKPETRPLDYALGSGKTGMTYVAVVNGDKLLETKMSYFPHQGEWEITPGQEISMPGDTAFGRIHDAENSRRCLGCHSVAVSEREARSAPGFYGVGCESCHGPGKAHVEAMQWGRTGDIHMERLGKLKSASLNDLCGKCHRTVQQIDINTPMAEETHRFQPFALLRSRCRNAAGGPLSCLQCHDAHTDASKDRAGYNRICVACHTGSVGLGNVAHVTKIKGAGAGGVCPVNSTTNCIDCHMRPRKAFMISTFPGTMVDHLISIPHKSSFRPSAPVHR